MELSVPEVSDLQSEPEHVIKLYGADDTQNPLKASFARNCILARRLVEKEFGLFSFSMVHIKRAKER